MGWSDKISSGYWICSMEGERGPGTRIKADSSSEAKEKYFSKKGKYPDYGEEE